ncbi:winged helix-turn-helix transcriptional regulator [Chryseobacterium gregarium]|uniref:winged helix-turn-helix transcriptional regulator n=1 Tax=Chryseobacterium gregarium TaxID=456299 RepID=UPI00373FD310
MSDRFDRQILETPSGNSGLSYAEIGRMISLSPSVTKERIRNLTDVGNQKDSV